MVMTSISERLWHHSTRHQALFEYASLKKRVPDGFYISLKPGNPLEWSGVLFLRKGPYAPAILRFLILYPHDYPSLPPTIIFITDVFHPLITPLTTYTYTTSSDSSDTVSASDDERLPPGGFNLRHGFSTWLGRAHKNGGPSTLPSIHASRDFSQNPPLEVSSDIKVLDDDVVAKPSENSSFQSISVPPTDMKPSDRKITIIEILEYVKRAFYDDQFLDGVPLEAAGNPGAWKAWRAYRASKGVKLDGFGKTAGVIDDREDWNWDGVWEQRVRKGVESSIADSTLYAGTSGGDDVIRFANIDQHLLADIKAKILGH